jgi:hypothetical protein
VTFDQWTSHMLKTYIAPGLLWVFIGFGVVCLTYFIIDRIRGR